MQLTKHFSLSELTVNRYGFPNQPNAEQTKCLLALATHLENVRDLLGGKPITVTSGFRTYMLNTLVGGAPKSDHMRGFACDFVVKDQSPAQVFRALKNAHDAGNIAFDQLIAYPRHTHISFAPKMRGQAW